MADFVMEPRSLAKQMLQQDREIVQNLARQLPTVRTTSDNWVVYFTHRRDSDIRELANSEVFARNLIRYVSDGTVVPVNVPMPEHGWVGGYLVEVVDLQGELNQAFLDLFNLICTQQQGPYMDHNLADVLEYRAVLRRIQTLGRPLLKRTLQNDPMWAERVREWLDVNRSDSLSRVQGPPTALDFGPLDFEVWEAMEALDIIDSSLKSRSAATVVEVA